MTTYSVAAWLGRALGFGTMAFFFSLAGHIFFWRLVKPQRQMLWLFFFYLLMPLSVLVACWQAEQAAAACLWYLSLCVSFLMSFPALQAESPTFLILLALHNRGGKMRESELVANLESRGLHAQRVQDLKADGLTHEGKLRASGKTLALFFLGFRRALQLDRGNG